MRVAVLVLGVLAAAHAGPLAQEDSALRLFANNFVNCINSDINLCLKEQALKITERLGTAKKLNIIEGVTLYNNDPKEAKSLDSLPTDPEERNKQVTERLWATASDLFRRSDLELSYGGEDDVEVEKESRAIGDVEESRGKKKKLKKKLKMLIPLAILGKIKAIALVVVALLIIAASIFKIAVLAKIAFIAKVIAIIKALIAKKHGHEETYVQYEDHGHDHGHGGGWEGGWSRSRNEGNSMAYSAYNDH